MNSPFLFLFNVHYSFDSHALDLLDHLLTLDPNQVSLEFGLYVLVAIIILLSIMLASLYFLINHLRFFFMSLSVALE